MCCGIATEGNCGLDLTLDMLRFSQDAAQAAAWVAQRGAGLTDSDIGASLEEAQALLKKHADLERALAAREATLVALKNPTKVGYEYMLV